jgi:hypothetical protein
MSKVMAWGGGLVLAGVLAGCGQPAGGLVAGSSWGKVTGVPGLDALVRGNGGGAQVSSGSCSSAGNCSAGGHYWDRGEQAFVAVERNGRWGKATGVPGLAALNQGRYASVYALSCAPAGGCAAGGEYTPEAYGQDFDGFLAAEENGRWGKAVTLPAEDGSVDAIFCVSAGNCLAGGTEAPAYTSNFHGFVAIERSGHWGKPVAVPGLLALSKGQNADVISAWCSSAGNCSIGGYTDGGGGYPEQAFVAVEQNGKWGTATRVPGLAALNKGKDAQVNSVSCASAGSCVAGGYYTESDGGSQGFVAVEQNGRWGKAAPVPGLAALDKGDSPTAVNSVSCTRAGGCVAGGFYTDRSRHRQGFVAREDNGVWRRPVPLPGLGALNHGGSAEVNSVWCAPSGNCAAGGAYTGPAPHLARGFVTQAR